MPHCTNTAGIERREFDMRQANRTRLNYLVFVASSPCLVKVWIYMRAFLEMYLLVGSLLGTTVNKERTPNDDVMMISTPFIQRVFSQRSKQFLAVGDPVRFRTVVNDCRPSHITFLRLILEGCRRVHNLTVILQIMALISGYNVHCTDTHPNTPGLPAASI